MTYHVIGPDGNRYGPADVPTLNQWIAEGRVTPTTLLEDAASGQRMAANTVPGLSFVPRMSAPSEPYGGPQAPGGYHQPHPGQPGASPGYYAPTSDRGDGDVTAAWVLGALGLLCCFICSIIGIVMASKAREKGNPSAKAAMIFCIVTLTISVVGNIVYAIIMFSSPEFSRGF